MTVRRWGSVLITAFLIAGCAYTPQRTLEQPRPSLPEELVAYYSYPEQPQEATVEFVKAHRRFNEYLVRFPLAAKDFEPSEPVVEFEWYESTRPGRRAAIVFNPILGGDYPLERSMSRFLARRGFHVAMIHRKSVKVSPEHSLDRLEFLLRQGVLRIRQIVDWLETHERVDPQRLGSFGVSMGGIMSANLAAIEPRLKAHAVILAGGSLADILMRSHDRLLKKPVRRYMEANGLDREQMRQALREAIRTDPITLGPYADPERIFMAVALFDRTIGRRHALALRRALGLPSTQFMLTGHYTSILYLPFIEYTAARFLMRKLAAPATP